MHLFSLGVFVFALQLPAQTPSEALRKLCDDFTEFIYRAAPFWATIAGQTEFDDRWQDLSPAAIASRSREVDTFSARLKAMASLNAQDRITAELLAHRLAEYKEDERITDLLLAAGPMYGVHDVVMQIIEDMPQRIPRDYENIIARLNKLPLLMSQQMALFD